MAIQEEARSKVTMDGSDAIAELDALKQRAVAINKELREMKKFQMPGVQGKSAEYDKLTREIKRKEKALHNLDAVIKNINGSSMKQLQRAQTTLRGQLRNNTQATREQRLEYDRTSKTLHQVNARVATLGVNLRSVAATKPLLQRLTGFFRNSWAIMLTTTAILTGVLMRFRSIVKEFSDFEAAVANLSALTGLAGEDLRWLAEEARKMSVEVVEGGVRLTASAKEVADAFTVVGSKRPELLRNKEALAEVTREAMILSKAARIELEPAVTALTTVMNQFSVGADQARRIINTLAAGSKVGAGNVAYINEVIEKAGTNARMAGLSIEQLVGTIEGIAPRFNQAEVAGTMLRGALLNFMKLDDKLNPTIVGWDQALANLAARQYSVTELAGMFEARQVTLVQALIDGREEIARYTAEVTDSNIAIEQAAINSDTFQDKLQQTRNEAQNLRLELGEKLAPAMLGLSKGNVGVLQGLIRIVEFFEKNGRAILAVTTALIAYTVVKKVYMKWQALYEAAQMRLLGISIKMEALRLMGKKSLLVMQLGYAKLTGNVNMAAAATAKLKGLQMTMPWGMVLGAIAAVTTAVLVLAGTKKKLTQIEEDEIELKKKLYKDFETEKQRIKDLVSIAKDENAELEKRQTAIDKLNEVAPGYHAYLTDEGQLIEGNTSALKDYLDVFGKKIELQAREASLLKLYEMQFDTEFDITIAQKKLDDWAKKTMDSPLLDKMFNVLFGSGEGGKISREIKNFTEDLDEALEKVGWTKDEIDRLQKEIEGGGGFNLTNLYGDRGRPCSKCGEDMLGGVCLKCKTGGVKKLRTAYEQLVHEISEAEKAARDFATVEDYDKAKAMMDIADALREQKDLIDEIISAGGDYGVAMDNLAMKKEEELLNARLALVVEGSEEEIEIRLRLQEIGHKRELQAVKDNEELKGLIKDRQNREGINTRRRIELKAEEDLIRAQLEIVREGTADETDLRIRLAENRRDQELLDSGKNADLIKYIEIRTAKEIVDEKNKLELAGLEKRFDDREMALMQARADELLTEEEYNKALLDLEEDYLDELLEKRVELGLDTMDIEWKILEFRLKMLGKEDDERKRKMEDWKRSYFDMAQSVSNAVEQIWAQNSQARLDRELRAIQDKRDAELNSEERTAEDIALINEYYAQKERDLKTDAWIKERTAKAIMSVVNTALAVTQALPDVARAAAAAVAGLAQTTVILSQPVPQFAKGKYPVIGQDDGRRYDATYGGSGRTGIYSGPVLVGERGPEVIIDSPTYRNLELNAPEIIDGIMAHRVPQYASGKWGVAHSRDASVGGTPPGAKGSDEVDEAVVLFVGAVRRFDEATKRRIEADVSLRQLRTREREMEEMEDRARL